MEFKEWAATGTYIVAGSSVDEVGGRGGRANDDEGLFSSGRLQRGLPSGSGVARPHLH